MCSSEGATAGVGGEMDHAPAFSGFLALDAVTAWVLERRLDGLLFTSDGMRASASPKCSTTAALCGRLADRQWWLEGAEGGAAGTVWTNGAEKK